MSTTSSCEVCGAPALARVGGIPFCAPCALQIGEETRVLSRPTRARWVRRVAGLGLAATLVIGALGAAAQVTGPSNRADSRRLAPSANGAAAAPVVFEADQLSRDAQDYAARVTRWADCVAEAAARGGDESQVLEDCLALQPNPLDPIIAAEEGERPVLAMPSRPSGGHVLEGTDIDVRMAPSSPPVSPPSNAAASPSPNEPAPSVSDVPESEPPDADPTGDVDHDGDPSPDAEPAEPGGDDPDVAGSESADDPSDDGDDDDGDDDEGDDDGDEDDDDEGDDDGDDDD